MDGCKCLIGGDFNARTGVRGGSKWNEEERVRKEIEG